MSWKPLGAVSPSDLHDARLQLHHAAQIVASAGITWLAPKPDDSHPNLGWVESLGTLMGRPLPGGGAQVGLRVADLSLLRVARGGTVQDETSLDRKTLEDGYAWLAAAVERGGAKLPADGVVRSSYEIPNHPTGSGTPFSNAERRTFEELALWFANGHQALCELTARTPAASEVRCWPHHFDLGSLIAVATDSDGGLVRSIGLGLSPGDDSYDEPYWYVSPWPYPEPGALPSLDRGGDWHTEGFTSAILTGSELVEGPRETQGERLIDFLENAIDKSRRILAD